LLSGESLAVNKQDLSLNKPVMSNQVQQPQVGRKWGGNRRNAGRKKKYGELTKVMTFRIPISKVDDVKQAISYILESKKQEETYFENNY